MSSEQTTIGTQFAQTLGRALTDLHSTPDGAIESGQWSEGQWRCFHQLGATQLLCSSLHEDEHGSEQDSTSLEDFMIVAATLGEVNAAFAGVEAIVAGWILNAIDLDQATVENIMAGATTIAVTNRVSPTKQATVDKVPWGRFAQTIVCVRPSPAASPDPQSTSRPMADAPPSLATITLVTNTDAHRADKTMSLENIAGEARDTIEIPEQSVHYRCPLPFDQLVALLALGKAAQMVGAMQEIVRLSADFVSHRQQFGRPLSRFQAIQHSLASMYAETVAASVATRAALHGSVEDLSLFGASAAIVRTRESATKVAALAHQVHGAMGFTDEYALANYSRRLWAWRDEYNSERHWQQLLGRLVLQSEKSLLAQLTAASG